MSVFSTHTLIFLLLTAFAGQLLPRRLRPFLLLAASILFYALIQPRYLPMLLLSCVAVWALGRHMERLPRSARKSWLIGGITIVTAPLLVFKYTNLFIQTLSDLLNWNLSPVRLLAPLGISFFTFRMISYLVDVSGARCKAEPSLFFLTLHLTWFPQILAGPIERSKDLLDQLKNPAQPDLDRALRRILAGLLKKLVIAERLAVFVDPVFRDPAAYAGINLIFAAVFFYLQIYCDFAAYTDLAVGVSELLGIRSKENFNHPLASRSISEFWRRWHITLSFWLRDYIFLPFSYSLLRRTDKWRRRAAELSVYALATTVTMFVAGLWHGAGWNFVIWGLLHAFFMIFSHLSKRTRKRLRRYLGLQKRAAVNASLQWTSTFVLLTLSWIFFRSGSVAEALNYLGHIRLGLTGSGWVHLGFTLSFAAAFALWEWGSGKGLWRRLLPEAAPVRVVLFALALCVLIVFSVDTTNEFIYFRF